MERANYPLDQSLARDVSAVPCDCGGFCDRVPATVEERRENGCHRDRAGDDCCAASFVCRLCSKRYAYSYEAPEME